MKKLRLLGAVCACLVAASFSVNASVVLDQEQNLTWQSASLLGGITDSQTGGITYIDRAQTFTVGVSGGIVRVDFALERRLDTAADLTLSIRELSLNGEPNGFLLGSSTVGAFDITTHQGNDPNFSFTSFDFSSAPIFVSTGTTLALVFEYRGVNPDIYIIWGVIDNYESGTAVTKDSNEDNWEFNGNLDYGFRTYVDTSVVPIPASLWLFGSGLLGLIGVARRKKV